MSMGGEHVNLLAACTNGRLRDISSREKNCGRRPAAKICELKGVTSGRVGKKIYWVDLVERIRKFIGSTTGVRYT